MGLSITEQIKLNQPQNIPQEVIIKIKERERLRKNKKFEQADRLRKEIQDLGYIVEDSQSGPRIFQN